MFGLGVRDDDSVELEVTDDFMIDANEKNTFLLKSMKPAIKKYQLLTSFTLKVNPVKEDHVEHIRLLQKLSLKILKKLEKKIMKVLSLKDDMMFVFELVSRFS